MDNLGAGSLRRLFLGIAFAYFFIRIFAEGRGP